MTPDPLASHQDAVYSLDELVAAANDLLPVFLPKDATGRAADGVTPRLVRFYATEGLLPEAHREGREARYSFEHLASLLAVRRLLAEGFGSAAIRRALAGRGRDELVALLRDEVQLQLVPTVTSALADPVKAEFLRGVRARAGLDGGMRAAAQVSAPREPSAPTPTPRSPGSPLSPTTWTRVTIQDGLELMVRDDFTLPTTPLGDQELLQLIKVVLLQVEQVGKKRK